MTQLITIVDYGMGNLHSVRRKLERIGARAQVSADPDLISRADKLVLPGVGHFARAMENLRSLRLLDALGEAATVRRVPLLGICLGMQLLAKRSEEGDVEGLGWLDADVVRFRVPDPRVLKVPHMGWNSVLASRPSVLLAGLPDNAEFYFVHSFHFVCRDPAITIGETEYGGRFTSAVERGNVFGAQFHPEKSHGVGELLLKNFTEL